MPTSQRFNEMDNRLTNLRSIFLPDPFDPTGTYDPAVLDQTTAYRVLVHAEFESFLEDIVRMTVTEALSKWNTAKTVCLPLVCLIGCYDGSEKLDAFTLSSRRPLTISTLLNKAHVHFNHKIDNNNSIRTKNLLALLVHAGVEENDLDATWVGAVDAFGAHRNVVGHQSGIVAYQADPKDAFDVVSTIKEGFRVLDELLVAMRAGF